MFTLPLFRNVGGKFPPPVFVLVLTCFGGFLFSRSERDLFIFVIIIVLVASPFVSVVVDLGFNFFYFGPECLYVCPVFA